MCVGGGAAPVLCMGGGSVLAEWPGAVMVGGTGGGIVRMSHASRVLPGCLLGVGRRLVGFLCFVWRRPFDLINDPLASRRLPAGVLFGI